MNPDQPETISSLKKHHLDPKIDDFQMKNYGAKHSPSSLRLNRPPAHSGGPRASA